MSEPKLNQEKKVSPLFGSEEHWDLVDDWYADLLGHRAVFDDVDCECPTVGEADLVKVQAVRSQSALRSRLRDLLGGSVPLAHVFTGCLNTAERLGLDDQPVRGDARNYVVPVGPEKEMSVAFQVHKPVAIREGGEKLYESVQPTTEEVVDAIQVMMGWLETNETIPAMEFGHLKPSAVEVR